MIKIKINVKPLVGALRDIGLEMKASPVIRNALNEAMDRVYTRTWREIGQHANLTAKHIRQGMRKVPASGSSMIARVVNTSGYFSVRKDGVFGARDTGRGGWKSRTGSGTFFRPWKDGRTVHARKGFMMGVNAGWTTWHEKQFQAGLLKDRGGRDKAGKQGTHKGIWHRMGKGRFPIEEIDWGPNPAKEMRRYGIPTMLMHTAAVRMNERVAHGYMRAVAAAKAKWGV